MTERDHPLEAQLRILATTDLHMQLLPYDYVNDKPTPGQGLAALGAIIESVRHISANTILLDNGDFLQGSPMADIAAEAIKNGTGAAHPAITAMNALGYDAAGIGNHEFDYGIAVLLEALTAADFPVLAANLRLGRGKAGGNGPIRRDVILTRTLQTSDGVRLPIRIGVFGLTLPQVESAKTAKKTQHVRVTNMVRAGRAAAARLRKEGADLVVALCHSGIATRDGDRKNTVDAIAALDGVDAVIGGHTHWPFPGPQRAPLPETTDCLNGRVAGKPVVLPGANASQLGCITLELERTPGGRWRVLSSEVGLLTPDPGASAATSVVVETLRPAHHATRSACAEVVGRAREPIQSLFPLILPDPALALVARAQAQEIARKLAGTPWADLPLLSAVAPRPTPGRLGEPLGIRLPAGPIHRRQIFDLAPFPDRCSAILVDGAGLRAWIDHAAEVFLPIPPDTRGRPLFDPQVPPYRFDVLHGLTYRLDLRPGGRRAIDLRYRGQPVCDDDPFAVALSSHRLGGGAGFGMLANCPVLVDCAASISEAILRHLSEAPVGNAAPPVWSFAPMPGTTATFEAQARLADLLPPGLPIRPIGSERDGLQRFELDLSSPALSLSPAAS